MFRITALILFASCLWLASLGVGGCGNSGLDPNTEIHSTDFEGEFSLRDDSCSSGVTNRIQIIHVGGTRYSLTVLDSGPFEGDIYYGDLDELTLRFSFPDGDCAAGRVTTEEAAANVEEMTTVQTEFGDITAVCEDSGSSDGVCFISYQPN